MTTLENLAQVDIDEKQAQRLKDRLEKDFRIEEIHRTSVAQDERLGRLEDRLEKDFRIEEIHRTSVAQDERLGRLEDRLEKDFRIEEIQRTSVAQDERLGRLENELREKDSKIEHTRRESVVHEQQLNALQEKKEEERKCGFGLWRRVSLADLLIAILILLAYILASAVDVMPGSYCTCSSGDVNAAVETAFTQFQNAPSAAPPPLIHTIIQIINATVHSTDPDTGIGVPFGALQDRMGIVEAKVDTVNASVQTTQASLTTVQGDVQAVNTTLYTLDPVVRTGTPVAPLASLDALETTLETVNGSLQTNLGDVQDRVAEVEGNVQAVNASVKTTKMDVQTLNSTFTSTITQLGTDLQNLNSTLASTTAQLSTDLQNVNSTLTSSTSTLATDMHNVNSTLTSTAAELGTHLQNVNSTLSVTTTELATDLQNVNSTLTSTTTELATDLHNVNSTLTSTATELATDLQNVNTTLASTAAQLATDLQNVNSTLASTATELATDLQNVNSTLTSTAAALTTDLNDVNTTLTSTAAELATDLQTVNATLTSATAELATDLQNVNATLTATAAHLGTDLQNVNSTLTSTTTELGTDLQSVNATLTSTAAELAKDLQTVNATLTSALTFVNTSAAAAARDAATAVSSLRDFTGYPGTSFAEIGGMSPMLASIIPTNDPTTVVVVACMWQSGSTNLYRLTVPPCCESSPAVSVTLMTTLSGVEAGDVAVFSNGTHRLMAVAARHSDSRVYLVHEDGTIDPTPLQSLSNVENARVMTHFVDKLGQTGLVFASGTAGFASKVFVYNTNTHLFDQTDSLPFTQGTAAYRSMNAFQVANETYILAGAWGADASTGNRWCAIFKWNAISRQMSIHQELLCHLPWFMDTRTQNGATWAVIPGSMDGPTNLTIDTDVYKWNEGGEAFELVQRIPAPTTVAQGAQHFAAGDSRSQSRHMLAISGYNETHFFRLDPATDLYGPSSDYIHIGGEYSQSVTFVHMPCFDVLVHATNYRYTFFEWVMDSALTYSAFCPTTEILTTDLQNLNSTLTSTVAEVGTDLQNVNSTLTSTIAELATDLQNVNSTLTSTAADLAKDLQTVNATLTSTSADATSALSALDSKASASALASVNSSVAAAARDAAMALSSIRDFTGYPGTSFAEFGGNDPQLLYVIPTNDPTTVVVVACMWQNGDTKLYRLTVPPCCESSPAVSVTEMMTISGVEVGNVAVFSNGTHRLMAVAARNSDSRVYLVHDDGTIDPTPVQFLSSVQNSRDMTHFVDNLGNIGLVLVSESSVSKVFIYNTNTHLFDDTQTLPFTEGAQLYRTVSASQVGDDTYVLAGVTGDTVSGNHLCPIFKWNSATLQMNIHQELLCHNAWWRVDTWTQDGMTWAAIPGAQNGSDHYIDTDVYTWSELTESFEVVQNIPAPTSAALSAVHIATGDSPLRHFLAISGDDGTYLFRFDPSTGVYGSSSEYIAGAFSHGVTFYHMPCFDVLVHATNSRYTFFEWTMDSALAYSAFCPTTDSLATELNDINTTLTSSTAGLATDLQNVNSTLTSATAELAKDLHNVNTTLTSTAAEMATDLQNVNSTLHSTAAALGAGLTGMESKLTTVNTSVGAAAGDAATALSSLRDFTGHPGTSFAEFGGISPQLAYIIPTNDPTTVVVVASMWQNGDTKLYRLTVPPCCQSSPTVSVTEMTTISGVEIGDVAVFSNGTHRLMAVAARHSDSRVYLVHDDGTIDPTPLQSLSSVQNSRDMTYFVDKLEKIGLVFASDSTVSKVFVYNTDTHLFDYTQTLPYTDGTVGYRCMSAFQVGDESYVLAGAWSADGAGNRWCPIFKWNATSRQMSIHQEVLCHNPWNVDTWTQDGATWAAIPGAFDGANDTIDTDVYEWNEGGEAFELVQSIPAPTTQALAAQHFASGDSRSQSRHMLAISGDDGTHLFPFDPATGLYGPSSEYIYIGGESSHGVVFHHMPCFDVLVHGTNYRYTFFEWVMDSALTYSAFCTTTDSLDVGLNIVNATLHSTVAELAIALDNKASADDLIAVNTTLHSATVDLVTNIHDVNTTLHSTAAALTTGLDDKASADDLTAVNTTISSIVDRVDIAAWIAMSYCPAPNDAVKSECLVNAKDVFAAEEECPLVCPLMSSEFYPIEFNAWRTCPDVPVPMKNDMAVAYVCGSIYLIGGTRESDNVVSDIVQVLDVRTRTWSTAAPISRPKSNFNAVGFDGKIYLFGEHYSPNNPGNETEIYDPLTNVWTRGADMPIPANGAARAVVVDRRIFVFGAALWNPAIQTAGNWCYYKVEVYLPDEDRWETRNDMPGHNERMNFGIGAVEGTIYIFAGRLHDVPIYFQDTLSYNPDTDEFTTLGASLTSARDAMGFATLNDKIYAVAGCLPDTPLSYFEEFDPTGTGLWTALANFPTAGCYMRSVGVGGSVFNIGGYAPLGPPVYSECWEYIPSEVAPSSNCTQRAWTWSDYSAVP